MIFSVEFRHQTEEQYLRENITIDCLDIASCLNEVESLIVVFYRQPQRNPLITCHLTMMLSGRKAIHIYEHDLTGSAAFEKVFQRLLGKLGGQTNSSIPLEFLQRVNRVEGATLCQV